MLAVSARGMWPTGHFLWLDLGPFEEQRGFLSLTRELFIRRELGCPELKG